MHFEGCKKKNSGSNLSNGAPSLREIWKFVGTDLENLGGGGLGIKGPSGSKCLGPEEVIHPAVLMDNLSRQKHHSQIPTSAFEELLTE